MPEELTACGECEWHILIPVGAPREIVGHWCLHGPKAWNPITASDHRRRIRCSKQNHNGHCPRFEEKR